MKKYVLLILYCFTFILSACSLGQAEEDTEEYFGIIAEGKTLGYEYTVTKEQNKTSWKIGYKGDISIIEEDTTNENDLRSYMTAVSDSKIELVKLIVSVSYFLIVIITMLITYKKNRKMLKDSVVIITVFAGIAVYFAFNASIDLSSLLRDAKYYYLTLIN